jgi:DNA-binding MarR family transcriptional regulator
MANKTDGEILVEIGRSWHRLFESMGLDRLGKWSDALHGISPVDLHIIRMAAEVPDVILKDIRDDLDVPQSTLTSIIDRLERNGVLERTMSRRDRRSYGLKLTKKGRKIHEEHRKLGRMASELMLEALGSEREARKFVNQLNSISDRLDKAYDERAKTGETR